jgi:hypothetical protein
VKKNYLIFIFCFALATFCEAQTPLPCDGSRIGSIILKPLVKNGEVHYEFAKKKGNNIVHNMVRIEKIDTTGNTFFAERYFIWHKDSALTLRYDYNKALDSCEYKIFVYHQSGIPGLPWILEDEPFLLDGAGNFIGKLEDDAMTGYFQRRIDHLLGLFK